MDRNAWTFPRTARGWIKLWIFLEDTANDREDLRLADYCRRRAYRALQASGRAEEPREFRWPCEHGAPVG